MGRASDAIWVLCHYSAARDRRDRWSAGGLIGSNVDAGSGEIALPQHFSASDRLAQTQLKKAPPRVAGPPEVTTANCSPEEEKLTSSDCFQSGCRSGLVNDSRRSFHFRAKAQSECLGRCSGTLAHSQPQCGASGWYSRPLLGSSFNCPACSL